MERKKVYEVINSEREYQIHRHVAQATPHRDKDHSVADWLIYMKEHIRRAEKHLYSLNQNRALNEIRKVTALGVACMENNETQPRRSS